MALKTDYKDDVFSGNRKYQKTDNSDGTISLVDKTAYSQKGDTFSAADINAINAAVNGLSYVATESASGLMSAADKAKFDNLQVGGRNLYLGTKDFSGSSWFPLPSWGKKEEKYNGLTVMARTGRWNGLCQTIEVKAGERYIFSCYVKNTADPSTHIAITNTNIANRATVDNDSLGIKQSPDFQKVSLTFSVLSDGIICPRIESDSGTSEICVCGLKLERGTVATDWTPAPEDVENEIKALNSVTKNFTLSASSWSSWSYTISDALITETSNQEVLPATSITADQMKALQKANIIDSGQSAGSLTLKALGTVPTIDIPIRIIFRGTI